MINYEYMKTYTLDEAQTIVNKQIKNLLRHFDVSYEGRRRLLCTDIKSQSAKGVCFSFNLVTQPWKQMLGYVDLPTRISRAVFSHRHLVRKVILEQYELSAQSLFDSLFLSVRQLLGSSKVLGRKTSGKFFECYFISVNGS